MFFNAVATVDVLTASNNDVRTCRNLNRTFCKFKIALSFWGKKKTRPRLLVLANFITCLPPEIQRDIASIPAIPKRVQRWRVL